MRILFASLLISLCFFAQSNAFAGGSVDLSELEPLLVQQKELWAFYKEKFDISTHGGGLRLSSQGIPLRGFRIGPYDFPAKLKGSKGDYTYRILINTDFTFYDRNKHEVTDQINAYKVEEMIISIAIAPLTYPAPDGSFIRSTK